MGMIVTKLQYIYSVETYEGIICFRQISEEPTIWKALCFGFGRNNNLNFLNLKYGNGDRQSYKIHINVRLRLL